VRQVSASGAKARTKHLSQPTLPTNKRVQRLSLASLIMYIVGDRYAAHRASVLFSDPFCCLCITFVFHCILVARDIDSCILVALVYNWLWSGCSIEGFFDLRHTSQTVYSLQSTVV